MDFFQNERIGKAVQSHFSDNRPINGHRWCGPGISEAQSGPPSMRGTCTHIHPSMDTSRGLVWCGAHGGSTCQDQDCFGYKTLLDHFVAHRLNSTHQSSPAFGVQAKGTLKLTQKNNNKAAFFTRPHYVEWRAIF